MDTAKLFPNGRSQAVRLPKKYAFTGEEVFIKKISGMVVLIPKDEPWKPFQDSLSKFTDDFMENERQQSEIENRPPLG